MAKWEYCVIGPVTIGVGVNAAIEGQNASVMRLTYEGVKRAKIEKQKKDDRDMLAWNIDNLGDEGWELIGCGNVGVSAHFLYFKREKKE
jgi:hypothetical protein